MIINIFFLLLFIDNTKYYTLLNTILIFIFIKILTKSVLPILIFNFGNFILLFYNFILKIRLFYNIFYCIVMLLFLNNYVLIIFIKAI